MQYRPEVDGLRAIAVLPVILFHAGFSWFSGGYVGVDVFFVISGYLITTIIAHEIINEKFSLSKFYERRAKRILPALFFVMFCCVPFAWFWMTPLQFENFSLALLSIVVFSSNILFWKNESYFADPAEENPLLHTWSLAVEEQFYIFFPLLLIFLLKRKRRYVGVTLFTGVVMSFLLAEWGWRNNPEANFYLLPTRVWELGVGAICAFAVVKPRALYRQLFSLFGFVLIASSVFIYDKNTPFPSVYAIAPVLGSALVILYAHQGTFVYRVLSNKVLVGVGLISYSAYLWHQPIFAFARIRDFSSHSPLLMFFLSVISLILAFFSWKYIEAPFRKKGHGHSFWGMKRVFSYSFLGMSAFLFVGYLGLDEKVSDFRLSSSQRTWVAEINELKAERQTLIKEGGCHFNGSAIDSDKFLDDWSCGKASAAVGLYGDSHAADKAVLLKRIGASVLQLGGARCPLYFTAGESLHCNNILRRFISEMRSAKISTVVLSNRFDSFELERESMEKMLSFWASSFSNVVIFSPMPEFRRFDAVYSLYRQRALTLQPDISAHNQFWSVVSQIDMPSNVYIVDSYNLFCGEREKNKCSPIQQGKPMLVDYGHLSSFGGKVFGDRLRDDEVLISLLIGQGV